MSGPNRAVLLVLVIVLSGWAVDAPAQVSRGATATVVSNAPIYIGAQVSPTPLRVAAPGTVLKVLQEEGDWLQVEFSDPQYGPRVGWVQRSLVQVRSLELQPMDLSVREGAPMAAPPPPPPRSAASYPGNETSIGWAFAHSSAGILGINVLSENIPLGWNVSTAWNVTPWLGVVADFGGHYNLSVEDEPDLHEYTHTLSGGVRFALRNSSVVVPYGQFLVGYVRSDATYLGAHEGANNLGILPSGGVDMGSPKLAARVEVGWGKVFSDPVSTTEFRLVVGVVIRSGGRQ
jgi:hypothetical protein